MYSTSCLYLIDDDVLLPIMPVALIYTFEDSLLPYTTWLLTA